ncbi:MAG TPA: GerMN domain-containing protein [Coleofasciculaceae cyanobacterium]
MHDQQDVRRIPIGLVASVAAALLTAGSGAAWWAWNSMNSAPTPSAPSTTTPSPQTAQPPTEQKVQIYWLNTTNNKIELAPSAVTLPEAKESSKILEGAFESLLAGPTNPAFSTTIPKGTELRNVSVESDGVHVDLSDEFTTGGGSTSMMGRVGQVVYTASSLDPNTKVWINVEGKPLDVLGGEGLELNQPLTRETFKENFPL